MQLPSKTKPLKHLATALLAAAVILSLPTCDKAPTASTSADTTSSADTAPASRPAGTPLFTLSPQTTAITSPLHPDGTPDYIAALNARRDPATTPDNNAFTAWLAVTGTGQSVLATSVADAVLAMSGAKPSSAKWISFGQYCDQHGHPEKGNASVGPDEEQKAQQHPCTQADFPFLAQFLQNRTPALDQAQAAWNRPYYWCPAVAPDGRSAADVLLPSLGITRDFANALAARASLRAGSNGFDGCLSDLLTSKHIAALLFTTHTTIEHLVAAAIESQNARVIAALAASGILSADQCTRLATALADPPPQHMDLPLDIGERWSALDATLLLATGHLDLLDKTFDTATARSLPTIDTDAVDWDAVLTQLNAAFDQEVHAAQQPLLEDLEADFKSLNRRNKRTKRDLSPTAGESRAQYSARIAAALSALLVPDLTRAQQLFREADMQFTMALALLAAAHHHAATGHWPNALTDLLPAELPNPPIDIYALGGKDPVHYLLTPNGPALYSIGRNRIDDDGLRDAPTHRDDIALGAPLAPPTTPALP